MSSHLHGKCSYQQSHLSTPLNGFKCTGQAFVTKIHPAYNARDRERTYQAKKAGNTRPYHETGTCLDIQEDLESLCDWSLVIKRDTAENRFERQLRTKFYGNIQDLCHLFLKFLFSFGILSHTSTKRPSWFC